MDYSIYVIKNTINNKYYVGQTKHYPFRRIYGHIHNSSRKKISNLLSRAIRRYGTSYFILEKVIHCPQEEADKVEERLIEYYNSLIPNGYNILKFGQVYNIPEGWWKGKKRAPGTIKKMSKGAKKRFAYLSPEEQEELRERGKQAHLKCDISKIKKDEWDSLSESEKKSKIEKFLYYRNQYMENETEEQRTSRGINISKAKKGIPPSEATIEAARIANSKPWSEERKKKHSQRLMGHKKKDTSKMRAARRAEVSEESKQRIIKIKKLIEEGKSNNEAAKFVGCTSEYVRKIRKGERGSSVAP